MSKDERPNPITRAVMFVLSCLGLAGLSDNIIEWQEWFERGIMEHWRFVKDWFIATFLDWLPFTIHPVVIDYMLLGGIVARSIGKSIFRLPRSKESDHLSFRMKLDIVATSIVIQSVVVLFWPIVILNVIFIVFQRSNVFETTEQERVAKKQGRQFLKRIGKILLCFVPFVFVVSDLLYGFS